MSLERWIPVPTSSYWYEHQVGGHGLIYEKKGKFLMLNEHVVLKPVQKYPKGLVELGFYQKLFDPCCTDPVLLALRPFVPTYKGLYYDEKDSTYYIGMENILQDMQRPSLIDCKMGKKTYDPYATESKVLCEVTKYFFRESVGFVITGIKVYDPVQMTFQFYDRFYGRSLDYDRVYSEGILYFLGPNPERATRVAEACLSKLRSLVAWFESQERFSFYSSSILLAYGENNHGDSQENVVVKWVDFTHVIDREKDRSLPRGRDENYLFGLRNLVGYLERAYTDLQSKNNLNCVSSALTLNETSNGCENYHPDEKHHSSQSLPSSTSSSQCIENHRNGLK